MSIALVRLCFLADGHRPRPFAHAASLQHRTHTVGELSRGEREQEFAMGEALCFLVFAGGRFPEDPLGKSGVPLQ
jgi:hypothetical protein